MRRPTDDPSETPTDRERRRPLLERTDLKPEDRRRIGRAVVPLLGWGLSASALLALLVLWHLVRRGRRLRANLAPPRVVKLIEVERDRGQDPDQDHDRNGPRPPR